NDDDTEENHQPTLRKNTAQPAEQTLKQYTRNARAPRPIPSTGPCRAGPRHGWRSGSTVRRRTGGGRRPVRRRARSPRRRWSRAAPPCSRPDGGARSTGCVCRRRGSRWRPSSARSVRRSRTARPEAGSSRASPPS
ncbi:hypothetical protein EHS19_09615, partial [Bifidobacterium jacchi]